MGRSMMARDQYTRGYWPQERTPMDPNLEEGRYSEAQDIRRPPMAIEQALEKHCNITGQLYFVAVFGNDGKTTCFTAPYFAKVDFREFFSMENFTRYGERAVSSNPPVSQSYEGPGFGVESEAGRYSMETGRQWTAGRRYGEPMALDGIEEDSSKMRKRPRVTQPRRRPERSEPPMITSTAPKKGITIGDERAVWHFYHELLKECQQNACKLIAKAWIKAVEPKKQSTHPYTGKDEKAPDWWPKPWGQTKDERVRHKEPDHLLRPERLNLLVHILRLIVEPNERQHPAIRKVNLDVTKLAEITMDALSTWFADKENPANAAKQPLLKELFKLARAEERLKSGEIDPTALVFVTSIDRMSQGGASDIDELGSMKDEEEPLRHTPISSNPSPQRIAHTQAAMPPHPSIDDGAPNHMQGVDFPGELMVRGTQITHPMLGSELGPERSTTFDVPEMMHLPSVYPNHQDSSRKSSNFASPSDYASPTTPIYPHWQAGSTPPNNQSMYSFQQHPPGPPPGFVGGPSNIHMTQNQQYLGTPFDAMSRGAHDSQGGGMFRPGGMTPSSLPHQPSYYDTATIPADVKIETGLRNPPH